MSRLVLPVALCAGACAPWRFTEVLCDAEPPPPGVVHVGPLVCSAQVPSGGYGRVGSDLYVATPSYRAVLRSPQDALTLSGVGGLTLVDWARWDEDDIVHELVPLIDDGWLHPNAWSEEPGAVRVAGTIGALPDAPDTPVGRSAEVVWRFAADRPCLWVEGADGWWVHGAGKVVRHGRSLLRGRTALVSEGAVRHDLGGAIRFDAGELCLDDASRAWSWLGANPVRGTSDGAVELWADDVHVGRLPDGALDTTVPDEVTQVRVVADDAAPGPFVPLDGTPLDLSVDGRGALTLALPDDGRWRRVSWAHIDGRSGAVSLPPGGGTVPTGVGQVELTVTAGPTEAPWIATVEVPPLDDEANEALEVTPTPRFDQGAWAAVGGNRPTDRSRSWRGADRDALSDGAAEGLNYHVFLVEGGTTEVVPTELGHPRVVAHGGGRFEGEAADGPWRVDAWPIRLSDKKNAWGTLQYPPRSADHALQLADGGANRLRTLAVDVPTLLRLGAPHAPDRPPDVLYLDAPDEQLDQWQPWFTWLDAARPLVPMGPMTWVRVADPRQLTAAEVDHEMRRGAVVTGTGERLELGVDGHGPGDLLPDDARPTGATGTTADTGTAPPVLTVHGLTPGLDRLRLVGTGGRVWHDGPAVDLSWPVPDEAGRWIVALATGPDGAWAVTGPVWLSPPR